MLEQLQIFLPVILWFGLWSACLAIVLGVLRKIRPDLYKAFSHSEDVKVKVTALSLVILAIIMIMVKQVYY